MKIMTMALRNVGRNKRRSILAAVSVALSAVLIMVMDGMTTGFLESMVKNYTKNDVGHFNVETEEFRSRERFMPATAA
ncbi:MAG: hypothetical protein Q8M76_03325, partial [Spirochaetaceae bacterium]|nr:hypothetical protein [Spirochaetaceae bacterium]